MAIPIIHNEQIADKIELKMNAFVRVCVTDDGN